MRAALVLVLVATCAGCGGPGPSSTREGSPAQPSAASAPASPGPAEAAFGVSPIVDGSITYQPDVVLVAGGGAMVRAVTEDGLTWTIDHGAGGIADVGVGDVMLLTGMVSGRVLALDDGPDGVAVTLGPVDLTDVIRDGHLEGSVPVDLDDATLVVFSESPDALDFTETGSGAAPRDAMLVSARTPSNGPPEGRRPSLINAPLDGGSAEVGIGPFAVKLTNGALEATYSQNGVDMVLEFGAITRDLRVDTSLDIVNGRPTNGRLLVEGLEGFSVKLKAGSTTGLLGNFTARVEVPISMNVPLYPPLYLSLQHKFYVETAFTAQNSFITDEAQYDLDGDIGWTMVGGEISLRTPTVLPTVDALDQLEGLSLGANGIVFAYQFKPRIGIGSPVFSAGPYAATTISLGLAVGSDAGIRGVKCHQSTVSVKAEGGVGYGWTAGTVDKVKSVLGRLGLADKAKLESEWKAVGADLYQVSTWEPDVPTCRLTGRIGGDG